MRLVDAFLSLPWILKMLVLIVTSGTGLGVLIPTLAFFYGIPVIRMMIDGRHVPNDAPFLQNGWHAAEDGFRWTTGMAQLPPLRMLTLLVAPIMPSSVYEADTSTEAAA